MNFLSIMYSKFAMPNLARQMVNLARICQIRGHFNKLWHSQRDHMYELNYSNKQSWPFPSQRCSVQRHALPKPATNAHHVKEQFSLSMESSVNKLTNCQYTTAKCWQSALAEACFWGLSDVHECSGVHWMSLVGFYRQQPCWKSPYDWLMI